MAGPNKDLFKRALSRIAAKGTQPQIPGGPNWQDVPGSAGVPAPTSSAPLPGPPPKPATSPPAAAAPTPATAAPTPAAKSPAVAPKAPTPAPVLREDDLIAQIEAEEEALMSVGAPASSGGATQAAPASAPAASPPLANASSAAAAANAARSAREAAAAMAARLSARRGGPPNGVGTAMVEERREATGSVRIDTLPPSPAPAAKPTPPAAPPARPAPEEKIPADDRRAGSERRMGGDRRYPEAPSGVPFASLAPIASAERKGGVGATFVPAAGPIPFAHIGAFRWLMPTTVGAVGGDADNDAVNTNGDAPVSARAPEPARPAPPPPAPVAEPPRVPVPPPRPVPPVAKVEPQAATPPAADPNDFLQRLNFNDLSPGPAQAAAVAAMENPLAGATDRNGDGVVGLSDVLEPGDEVMDFSGIGTAPAPEPAPIAARAPIPARAPTPPPAPAPVAPPVPEPPRAVAPPPPAARIEPPAPPPLPPPVPAPIAAAFVAPAPVPVPEIVVEEDSSQPTYLGSPTLAAAELLKSTIAGLGTQVRERDDIARIVLGYATQRFRRAALFVIKKEMLVGWEGGGNEISRAAVRGIMVPLTNPSIFKTVFETKVLYCGGVPHTTVNDIFFNAIGEPRPERVVVVPFVLKDKVACVLYADGGDIDDENPASIGELYQLGRAVSSAFENLILRAKRS